MDTAKAKIERSCALEKIVHAQDLGVRTRDWPNSTLPSGRQRISQVVRVLVLGATVFAAPLVTAPLLGGEFGATAAFAEVNSPSGLVKDTVNRAIEIVKRYPKDSQASERRGELRKIIEPRFNFQEMSQRALGPIWPKLDSQQQTEFSSLFSDLLALTYLKRIEHVQEGMVVVKGEKLKDDRALVNTTITYQGDTFPLDYKLQEDGGAWRVYDVVIENIGLVSNYRNEFAGIVRKYKIEGLLSMLKSKVEKLRAE